MGHGEWATLFKKKKKKHKGDKEADMKILFQNQFRIPPTSSAFKLPISWPSSHFCFVCLTNGPSLWFRGVAPNPNTFRESKGQKELVKFIGFPHMFDQ